LSVLQEFTIYNHLTA